MRYFYDGSADDGGHAWPDEDDEPRLADADASVEDDDDDLLDDGSLDDDFPRGDGTADTEAVAYCPYCGELNEIAVDPGGGSLQSYVEDCQVCCRPWRVVLRFDTTGHAVASVEAADDL